MRRGLDKRAVDGDCLGRGVAMCKGRVMASDW